MKKTIKIILSLILIFTLVFTSAGAAFASGRIVNYLSDLHMSQAKTAEEAKKLLTDNGYTVIDKNLNPDGESCVYLGYKTSGDVEDAITDISVMNMKGGYNISDYEHILKTAFDEYKASVVLFRTAAEEFAENYKAGKAEALLAYRQLNYYYDETPVLDEKGEAVLDEEGNAKITTTKMGDYMLSFPEKDEDFADILLKGNVNILNNIRSLLAMGVGKGDILRRINDAAKDPAVYSKVEYYDLAKNICDSMASLSVMKASAEADFESINNDETIDQESKDVLLALPAQTLYTVVAVEGILSNIPYKDTNLLDYMGSTASPDYSAFYPIVEVLTKGQRALAETGQIVPVLLYDEVEMTQEDIEAQLLDIEETYSPQSVYLGADMELYEGSFALTKSAVNHETSTGMKWMTDIFGKAGSIVISSVIGLAGAVLAGASITYIAKAALRLPEGWVRYSGDVFKIDPTYESVFQQYIYQVDDIVQNAAENHRAMIAAGGGASSMEIVASTLGISIGLATLGLSIYSIILIANSYKTEYTDIPINMVDVVETDSGSRFIRYSVVDCFYKADGKVKTRAGDTNAYDGKQWNAIYYTKSYEAGKCMTSAVDFPAAQSDFGKYSPVRSFGENLCYDLNAFNSNDSTEKIFFAFSNSNNKKAADTAVPSVVGSIITFGVAAVSGVLGVGLGMGIMGLINKRKKCKGEN